MLRPQRLLGTYQRPFEKRFGLAVAALRLIEHSEIVYARQRVGMLRP